MGRYQLWAGAGLTHKIVRVLGWGRELRLRWLDNRVVMFFGVMCLSPCLRHWLCRGGERCVVPYGCPDAGSEERRKP